MTGDATTAALSIRGVTKRFGGFTAISDLTIDIERGKVTGLVGPNGAGKTTIVNLATGMLRPDTGSIHVDGEDIADAPIWKLARRGVVRSYQDLRLYSALSVLDNVAGVEVSRGTSLRAARRQAYPVLDEFGLSDVAMRTADSLSYAEQKRLSLARVFASDARVVLLDEPASGLDESSTRSLTTLLRDTIRARGSTAVLVEHNLDIVKEMSDTVAFLANGQLIAQGSPSAIFARDDLASLYFGATDESSEGEHAS